MTLWLCLTLASGITSAGLPPGFSDQGRGGQQDWLVRAWQNDEGLVENNILGMAQTPDGYLWLATASGLTRFDGASFQHFILQHLPDAKNRVLRGFYLDHRGRFWVSMSRGVLFCAEGGKLDVFTERQGLSGGQVSSVADDNTGTVWLASGGQLFRVVAGKVEAVDPIEGLPSGGRWLLARDIHGEVWCARGPGLGLFRGGLGHTYDRLDSAVVCIAPGRDGGVWVATESALFRCREGQKPKQVETLPNANQVRALLEDRQGALWIGGAGLGLKRLTEGGVEGVPVYHSDVTCLTEDEEGNIWVGTRGGGLNLVRGRGLDMVPMKADPTSRAVRSITEDSDGNQWAVLENGELMRERGSEWVEVDAREGWAGGEATCVAGGPNGVWAGTRSQGLFRLKNGGNRVWERIAELGDTWVRSILETRRGDLFFATGGPNRLWLLRQGELRSLGLPADVRVIRALAEGADGTVWAGSSDGQLLRITGEEVLAEPGAGAEPLPSIRALHVSRDGSLWIGFAGAGIGRLAGGRLLRLTTESGLPDNFISQIQSDHRGGLWMCCNRGVFQVHLEQMVAATEGQSSRVRPIVYGRSDGLPSLQPSFEMSPRTHRTAAGELLFSTRNGLLRVRPDRILDNPVEPPVLLKSVAVDDRLIAEDDTGFAFRLPSQDAIMDLRTSAPTLRMAADHKKLEIKFTALSYTSVENVHFRYRLSGFDHDWVEGGGQRQAIYPRLAPGQYRFEVTACNNAGVWNAEGRHLGFIVLPFFWQTWWFRVGTVGLAAAGLVGLVRYFSFRRLRRHVQQLEQQAELQRERARIARDMHDEVGAKLSRLSLLSEMTVQHPAVGAEARAEVAEISDTAREAIRSFEEIVWAVTPTNDTLQNLVNYLCRFAEEFFEGSEAQCVFDLPENIPAVGLSTDVRHHVFLAAKEALNNILKHARARRVEVRLRIGSSDLTLEIADDGVGFDPSVVSERAIGRNGVGNMRERMRLCSGEMDVASEPGKGTTVRFRVPFESRERA